MRQARVHWNAATVYRNMEDQLLDLLEECTPLPTDLCSMVLDGLGERFDMCLPLPAGCAQLRMPTVWHGGRDAIQLRTGASEATYELPFRGGGFLEMRGALFELDEDNSTAAWYALPSIISPNLSAPRLLYSQGRIGPASSASASASSAALASDEEDEPSYKRRRVDKATDPRWSIHEQSFAYYQLVPGFGVNLLRDPSRQDARDLVSGVCLVFGNLKHGSDGRLVIHSISPGASYPDLLITSYFRPPGVCEWSVEQCRRHAVTSCMNGCCSADHCAAAVERAPCEQHTE